MHWKGSALFEMFREAESSYESVGWGAQSDGNVPRPTDRATQPSPSRFQPLAVGLSRHTVP